MMINMTFIPPPRFEGRVTIGDGGGDRFPGLVDVHALVASAFILYTGLARKCVPHGGYAMRGNGFAFE